MPNAQGEDVVAGTRTPLPISAMQQNWPAVYAEFKKYADLLEHTYRDMQDLEFTVENGKLFMLQTRSGKRSAVAAVKIAVDMVNEKVITKEEAVMRVQPLRSNSFCTGRSIRRPRSMSSPRGSTRHQVPRAVEPSSMPTWRLSGSRTARRSFWCVLRRARTTYTA
jgi:hypothetical protein